MSDKFDPLAYIENAFHDTHGEKKLSAKSDGDLSIQLPSIGSYINGNPESAPKNGSVALLEPPTGPKTKFRRRKLSAPRPRRSKETTGAAHVVDQELQDIWSSLPKNIAFLSSFFDDAVTANYYRGEFKESRQELMRRLLDPELSLEEVSRLLGVCPATVRRYTNRNWLEHHRTQGGQRRFRLSGVVKFVDQHGRHPEA